MDHSNPLISNQDFFTALFDAGEKTCFAENKYGTTLYDVNFHDKLPMQNNVFFSINPMHTSRMDKNVTCYRNILIEFDTLTGPAQLAAIESMPFTTLVWSGGKSCHAILSLETSRATEQEYRDLVKRIQIKMPDMDRSTGNPSRFSRFPGATRDNGQKQYLFEVFTRVSDAEILDWLGPAPIKHPVIVKIEPADKERLRMLGSVSTYYFNFGETSNRNNQLFMVACDMLRSGYKLETVFEKVMEVTTLSFREVHTCVKSAYKTVRKG